jgi:hypothetical protein
MRLIANSIIYLFLTGALLAEASDIGVSHHPASGYVLQRGVLQLETYGNYTDVDMAEAVGVDTKSTQGVGRYSEIGGRLWFGLSDLTTASFYFGLSDFTYQDKTAEIGFQEFRLKRGLLVNHESLGFLSLEAEWFRHSMNSLKQGGVKQSRSNTFHDYGYGLQLQGTRPFSDTFDLHYHLGYSNALEDGNEGQSQFEAGVGLSAFFSQRYRLDLYGSMLQVDRSINSIPDETNSTFHFALTRHISEQWSGHIRAQYNDSLFIGVWPFLDREMSNVNLSGYGYLSLGFTYRTKY